MNIFTEKDLAQIKAHGLTLQTIETQMENFKKGFPYLAVAAPATAGDGIKVLTQAEADRYAALYDERAAQGLKTVKFVPASGAATRMFKELFEYLSDGKESDTVNRVVEKIDDFAFAPLITKTDKRGIIDQIINKEGLGYGTQPKALILFHKYPEGPRTAAEEHLAEGAMYAASKGVAHIHFTVSGEHLEGFKTLFARVVENFEKRFGVKYDITFSQQKPSTDTIAVNQDNTPFREADGSLLFRPAGHGALLENLADIDADVVFVKNIDNVAPDRLKPDTVKYKKALAGLLAELQKESFELQRQMDVARTAKFVEEKLSFRLPEGFADRGEAEKSEYLQKILDRPMRVCGVVRNEGEPGGGPFWVAAPDGSRSLQIAESSQIAPGDMHLMTGATHFNPVDLVCAVRDANGRKYELGRFTDPATGFISEKSKDGRKLRAQELPGLWNGAMAQWNTILVEVPMFTFSPVKVVTALLRPQHQ